jgi:hypothetical protein
VLREVEGWGPLPYQWATVGYRGAISTGRTICGILFGASVFLGYLSGTDATDAPEVKDKKRDRAIKSVNDLFQGFIKQFENTDCQTLTGCDWSKKEDRERYYKEETYKGSCYRFYEYVLARCLEEISSSKAVNKDQ